MNDIMRYLQQKNEEMLAELKALVEQESPTKDKVLIDAIAASVAELFERLTGGRAEIIPNETYGNHVRGEWGFGEEQILLLGHFDTVWKQGILEEMPFRVEDGKAYGPGIFDMKGGLVQGIYALHALTAMKKPVQSRVVFLFTSDEEIGSPTSREWIEREAARSKCVFVLEPSASPHGALKTSRKGIGSFRLKTKGVPVHAGIDYERGRSAIEELSRQIIYLHGLTDLEAGSTVNVGVIKGGTAANVVAEEAEAEIDLRIQNEAEAKRMFELMLGAAPLQKDTSVEVTGGIRRPPMELNRPGGAAV
ncbi:M20 family metallopeptidase [Paenibacillus sp. TAB 01]|uniref:M20 family metallopeptidase n=1 Tax=Paenibacillus sp. TAB 01 TaxID=3368988 RepID=UPI0037535BB7